MRTKIVAGNWKMNKTPAEARVLIAGIRSILDGTNCPVEVVVCPPLVDLTVAAEALKGSFIGLGAQNMHAAASGAYTGEVSAQMLVETGVKYVILGHSERRALFGETDAQVNAKTKAALAAGLVPIVCVGETLEERESNRTDAVVTAQVMGSLADLGADLARCVVAYEPVWAIGTGRTASPDDAQAMHAAIRGSLSAAFRDKVRILYGGSVKADNAAALLGRPDVDGALVGGASLKTESFLPIIRAAKH